MNFHNKCLLLGQRLSIFSKLKLLKKKFMEIKFQYFEYVLIYIQYCILMQKLDGSFTHIKYAFTFFIW